MQPRSCIALSAVRRKYRRPYEPGRLTAAATSSQSPLQQTRGKYNVRKTKKIWNYILEIRGTPAVSLPDKTGAAGQTRRRCILLNAALFFLPPPLQRDRHSRLSQLFITFFVDISSFLLGILKVVIDTTGNHNRQQGWVNHP